MTMLSLKPRPKALLFDMDGVLADVSGSYRQAIIQTLARWGVNASYDDIAAAKSAGNANNDWVVTRRMLAARGIDVPLDEVTRVFEELYQGTLSSPGLWKTEKLLPSRELLARLHARLPLGVVTGRPRADATRFLKSAEISRYFACTICMEDAPAKPDPTPVRLALKALAVEWAWLIGDSPDDMRAAHSAGIMAIGIVAPGDKDAVIVDRLETAGASMVLRTLDDLENLIS